MTRLALALTLLAASPLAWAAGKEPGPIGPLRVADAEGNALTLDAPGVLYLVDFWALGCKPCIMAMPELDRLAELLDSSTRGIRRPIPATRNSDGCRITWAGTSS